MIELRGIIRYRDNVHELVDLVVAEHRPDKYKRHHMGVDIKPNRGRIITFLGKLYNVPPGDIVWPDHIELKTGG